MIMASLSIFQAWIWIRVGMGSFLNGLSVSKWNTQFITYIRRQTILTAIIARTCCLLPLG
jgi:hypothetical protein